MCLEVSVIFCFFSFPENLVTPFTQPITLPQGGVRLLCVSNDALDAVLGTSSINKMTTRISITSETSGYDNGNYNS